MSLAPPSINQQPVLVAAAGNPALTGPAPLRAHSMLSAALRGLRLLQACRVLPARSPAWPLQCRLRALNRAGSRGGGDAWDDGKKEDGEEEEEEEEEELFRTDPLLPTDAQSVCVLHPDVRGPAGRTARNTAQWDVAEATALVHSLPGWSVSQTLVVPTRAPERKQVFGKGNFRELTDTIRGNRDITSVFLNVERMGTATQTQLEAAWHIPVFDRFATVLHVFRLRACTREARLQLALAELPLLRAKWGRSASKEQPGWGSRYIMGSGESLTEQRQRMLRDREAKIRRALDRLRDKRGLLRRLRERREFPVVSVVGYTNCGKTTLIKALTGDPTMQPRDQLFATLDITAHAGSLPSRVPVLYIDTIGFLSQLPHGLIQSFSATLEDVAHSDVIVHVRDVSHPDTERQKATVLSTLSSLCLPPTLLGSVVEVHNKIDLVPEYHPPGPDVIPVSALLGQGLNELKVVLEEAVLRATGRRVLTVRVPLGGAELSWLYRETTVQQVQELPKVGLVNVTILITQSAYGRFRKLFPGVPE